MKLKYLLALGVLSSLTLVGCQPKTETTGEAMEQTVPAGEDAMMEEDTVGGDAMMEETSGDAMMEEESTETEDEAMMEGDEAMEEETSGDAMMEEEGQL